MFIKKGLDAITIPPNKRTTLTLYSGSDPYSHRVRMVLAEKDIPVDIIEIEKSPKANEELAELNPYGQPPLLMDRELVLYQSEIIMEYLDERFPHPPLLPPYPVARARSRLMIYRINRNWGSLMDKILNQNSDSSETLEGVRKALKDSITSLAPIFKEMPYFLSEEFSLVDCCIIPLLWRLPLLKVVLPIQAKPVLIYADRLFERKSFKMSLTETELALQSL